MAKKPRDLMLLSPTGGLVRRFGYQQQPPYTTPDCLNVRSFDTLEGRERCGSRPGLAKSFVADFGGAIQSLCSVTVAEDDGSIRDVLVVVCDGVVQYTDSGGTFQSPMIETVLLDAETNNGAFEDATDRTLSGTNTTTMTRSSGDVVTMGTASAHGLAAGDVVTVTGLTGDEAEYNEGIIELDSASGTSLTYTQVGKGYDASATNTSGAIYKHGVTAFTDWTFVAGSGTITGDPEYRQYGTYAAKLSYDTGESYIYQLFTVTAGAECTLRLWTRGDDSVAGQYRIKNETAGTDIVAKTTTGVSGSTYSTVYQDFTVPAGCTSIGIYLYSPGTSGDAYFDNLKLTHRVPSVTPLSSSVGTISSVGLLQKVYFADALDEDVSGTKGVVASGVLTDDDISDWTALGLDADTDYVTIVSDVTAELFEVERSISEVTANEITLAGGSLAPGPVTFTLRRPNLTGTKMIYHVGLSPTYYFHDVDIVDWTQLGIPVGAQILLWYTSTADGSTITRERFIDSVGENYLELSSTITDFPSSGVDWEIPRFSEVELEGTIGEGNVLTSPSVSDWTEMNIGDQDSVVLDRTESGFAGGKYRIAFVAAGGVTIDTDEIPDGSEYRYQIGRNIQVLDPDTGVMAVLEDKEGISPLNCSILCNYRGRLVAILGNTWFMCRQNAPHDWDYGADDEDTARAMAGGVAEAADVPDPIVAAVAHTDDYMLFFCSWSIWLMRGDPAAGGELDPISHDIGIVSRTAYCQTPDGMLVFLSRAGLYLMPAGGNGYPVPFSDERVPQELVDVDAGANKIVMEYDAADQLVHLYITPTDGSAGTHWHIDWRLKGMWPVSLPAAMQPYSTLVYASDASDARRVLLGCRDGYIREFDASAADDDGTSITSYMQLGPFMMASPGRAGIATHFAAVLDEDSGNVDWEFRTGRTGEAAVDSTTAKTSGVWSGGWNRPRLARVCDAVGSIYVAGKGSAWAIESVNMKLLPAGRVR